MNNQVNDTAMNDNDNKNNIRENAASGDLPDSLHDEERMQPEEIILDLPDVKDIPGQEHIHVAPLGELADTTISSDDEEGVGIFGDDDEDLDEFMGNETNVTGEERKALEQADKDMPTDDDTRLRRSELDSTDLEGDALNEGSLATDVSGGDLDTSGTDSDDPMENIGEEDEENNTYSLGGDSKDNITEGTP